jgi:hypothetical protein
VLFLYLVDPVMKLFGYLLFNYGSSILRAYIDRLFEQAALLEPPNSALMLLVAAFGVTDGLVAGLTVSLFMLRYRKASKNGQPEQEKRAEARRRRLPWIVLFLSLLMILVSIPLQHSVLFQSRIISSFNQHLTAIAPYVTDQEARALRSRWTQMQSENDYRVIYADLERIAANNHVRLPENKVFSLTSF